MRRKSLLLIFILVFVLFMCVLFAPYQKKINVTVTGYCADLIDTKDRFAAQVSVQGVASYHFFSLKEFSGIITMNDTLHLQKSHPVYIQFGNGLGQINCYEEGAQLSQYKYYGYLCTYDFTKLLLLFYDENNAVKHHRYFVGPVEYIEKTASLAKQLSEGTPLADINWE